MTILVLAPHADDETLGMGGTIARRAAEGKRVVVAVLTGHGETPHPLGPPAMWDKIRDESRRACDMLGVNQLIFRELPAVHLDHLPARDINRVVADLIAEVGPDEVFVPFAHDIHRDHGSIAYAVNVATRPYLAGMGVRRVIAYETLSETHLASSGLFPAFQPNLFVAIPEYLDAKLNAMRCYASQLQPDNQPRSIAGIAALARFRGTHIGCEAAEAFMLLLEMNR